MQAEFQWGSNSNTTAPSNPVRVSRDRDPRSQRFAAAVCDNYDDTDEVEAMCDEIKSELDGQSPDIAMVFASSPKYADFEHILPAIHRNLGPDVVIGCSGSGVIGSGRELETGPGLSVLAATCDADAIQPFAFSDKQACGKEATPESLADAIGADPAEFENGLMLIFIDPLTVSTEYSLSMLDSVYPSVMKFGALVSGGHEYGENRLFFGDELRHHGAVGLLLKQNFDADTIVSGSEEPVGPSMVITKSTRNEIHRLDDRNPMAVLEDIFLNADPLSQIRMKRTLVVGLESSGVLIDPDYVMRNIMDIDQETGAMMIGDLVEEGQALQFHVRDGELASQRLTQNLDNYVSHVVERGKNIDAMLCFNSVARGYRMFEEDDHDAKIIAERFGDIPMAGFFSNGEIASRRGGFSLLDDEEEFSTRVMGYSDTLVMLRDLSRQRSHGMASSGASSSAIS